MYKEQNGARPVWAEGDSGIAELKWGAKKLG